MTRAFITGNVEKRVYVSAKRIIRLSGKRLSVIDNTITPEVGRWLWRYTGDI